MLGRDRRRISGSYIYCITSIHYLPTSITIIIGCDGNLLPKENP